MYKTILKPSRFKCPHCNNRDTKLMLLPTSFHIFHQYRTAGYRMHFLLQRLPLVWAVGIKQSFSSLLLIIILYNVICLCCLVTNNPTCIHVVVPFFLGLWYCPSIINKELSQSFIWLKSNLTHFTKKLYIMAWKRNFLLNKSWYKKKTHSPR